MSISGTSFISSLISQSSFLEWPVEDVVNLFSDIGLERYSDVLREAEINGETLAYSDNDTLKDLGGLAPNKDRLF